jgi:acyl carrier protein
MEAFALILEGLEEVGCKFIDNEELTVEDLTENNFDLKDDLGMDSLDMVEFGLFLEGNFEEEHPYIDLSSNDEFLEITHILELRDYISKYI